MDGTRRTRGSLRALGDLGAELVLLRGDLGTEVLRFPERTDLEVRRTGHRVGAALRPLQSLVHRPHLPDPEPGHQLLALGERAVSHRPFCAVDVHPLPELARLEAVTGEHDPG